MRAVVLALALLVPQQQADVTVEATLSETTVVTGSSVTLQLRVRTDGARPRIDPLTGVPAGLDVVSTRSSDQRQFSLPGGTRRHVSRDFVILARRAGRYTIPSIHVQVDGRDYRTRSLLLTVEPASRGSGRAPEEEEEGVALRAWLDTDTAYVGQQIIYSAEALFGSEVRLRLRRSPEYEPPNPSGFWIHELPGSPTGSTRIIGSDIYEVQTFRRGLFPIAPGRLTILPARLTYEVRRGLLSAPETRAALSDTLSLTVLPVPERGRPDGYTGAVGRYRIQARVEPRRVVAGDAAVLSVEIDGTGNVKSLPAPELPQLDGVEIFPPSEDATVDVTDGVVGGTKRFEWVMVPSRAGTLAVPEIRYPFFDPDQGRFHVAATGPLELEVLPGGSVAGPTADDQLRFLKLEPSGPSPLAWVRSPLFAALQLLPLALLALVLLRRRPVRDRRPGRRELRRMRREALERLRLRAASGDGAFFGELEGAVRRWLAQRSDAPSLTTATPDTVAARLEERGVDRETARAAAELLGRLGRARYEPEPPGRDTRQVFLQAAERLMESVDRALAKRRGPWRAGVVFILAAAAALAVPGPARAQDPFSEGVEAYRSDDAAAAVTAFDAWAQEHPDDPAGWYNLGNAYQAEGRTGAAVWAWLRATRLAPRDDDVRHNLEVAGADPVLVDRARPLWPLSTGEALFLASLAWLLGGSLLVAFVARRRRWHAAVGGVLVIVALALAGEVWSRRAGPELAVVTKPATLRAGPTLRGEDVAQLDGGAGVEVVARHEDWMRVRTLDGHDGWLETRQVAPL